MQSILELKLHYNFIDNHPLDVVVSWLAFLSFQQLFNWFKALEDPEVVDTISQEQREINSK